MTRAVRGLRPAAVLLATALAILPPAARAQAGGGEETPPPALQPGVRSTTLSEQLTVGLGPLTVCPRGYMASHESLSNLHLVVCIVPPPVDYDRCEGRPGTYQCGVNAEECCPKGTDNTCFEGAYPCADNPAEPGRLTACCMAR